MQSDKLYLGFALGLACSIIMVWALLVFGEGAL